jgi:hypothetical protein
LYSATGLVKYGAWEEVWRRQRVEDDGQGLGEISPPPDFAQGSRGTTHDFRRAEFWRLRGKLDVPKERFIAFTEVPADAGAKTLYGWAGATPLQRLRTILAIDEELDDRGVVLADRVGLLDSAWRLLPYVTREDASVGARLRAELQALVGPQGPSGTAIDDWRQRFPPPGGRTRGTRRVAADLDDEVEADESDES